MKTRAALLIGVLLFTAAGSTAALAYPWGYRGPVRYGPRDWGVWRGGGWRHGWYGGRFGWWWVVGGAWYFYSAPAYPYPDPSAYGYPVDPVPAAPVVAAQPQAQYWYWCPPAKAYYPYVQTCPSGWQTVPAAPAAPPAAPAPAPGPAPAPAPGQ